MSISRNLNAVILILALGIYVQSVTNGQQKYHTHAEMTDDIQRLISKHKEIAKLESIGKTLQRRDIWAVTIGGKHAEEHHALLVTGGAEANRIIGSELSVKFIEFLLNNYARNDSIARLIDSTTFYVIPRVSPDASEAFFQKPLYERTFNTRPTDDDRDGTIDEDGYEDLNGDGIITMMRVKDDRGEWIVHPEDRRIMKKADPAKGERGQYRLYSEGVDNDKDEQWNEDEPGGVDFNRNFPHNYGFFTRGAGPHQVSEEETRSVIEFAFAHPNIAAVFSFSSQDNLMNPWKKEPGKNPQPPSSQPGRRRFSPDEEESQPRFVSSVMDADEEYYAYIAAQYQKITGLKVAAKSAKGEGAFCDWAYYQYGRWSFAANPWWVPDTEKKSDTTAADTSRLKKEGRTKPEGPEEKPDECADQIKALRWIDANNIRDGFVNWTRIKHPDFPDNEVEVGGFRPYILTNPPPDSIEPISSKENSFLAMLAGKLPDISIRNLKVESIDKKVYRLKADIVNTGYLPSNSAMGAMAEWPRNPKVSLKLSPDQKLLSGKAVTILDPIKGSGGRAEMNWLILAPSGSSVTITAESPTSGRVSQTITFE